MALDFPTDVSFSPLGVAAVIGLLLWRLGYILKQDVRNHPPPVQRTQPSPARSGLWRSLFPTRMEQLARATGLTRAEIDLVNSKSEALEAQGALVRAEAALATLRVQTAQAQPAPPPSASRPELTLTEIEQVLALANLTLHERDDLLARFAARIQDTP